MASQRSLAFIAGGVGEGPRPVTAPRGSYGVSGCTDIRAAVPARPSTSEGLRSGRFQAFDGMRSSLDVGLPRFGLSGGVPAPAVARTPSNMRWVPAGKGVVAAPEPMIKPQVDSQADDMAVRWSDIRKRGGWPQWGRHTTEGRTRVGQKTAQRSSQRSHLGGEGGALGRERRWAPPSMAEIDRDDELRQRLKDTKVFTAAFHLIDLDRSGRVDAHDVRRLIKSMGQVVDEQRFWNIFSRVNVEAPTGKLRSKRGKAAIQHFTEAKVMPITVSPRPKGLGSASNEAPAPLISDAQLAVQMTRRRSVETLASFADEGNEEVHRNYDGTLESAGSGDALTDGSNGQQHEKVVSLDNSMGLKGFIQLMLKLTEPGRLARRQILLSGEEWRRENSRGQRKGETMSTRATPGKEKKKKLDLKSSFRKAKPLSLAAHSVSSILAAAWTPAAASLTPIKGSRTGADSSLPRTHRKGVVRHSTRAPALHHRVQLPACHWRDRSPQWF